MTAIVPLSGTQVYIKIEDDASPANFAHPCLINTKRGVSFKSKTNEVIVPDCDNPDDPAWTKVMKDGLSCAVDGAGKLDNKLATIQAFDTWYRGKGTKRVRIYLGNVGYWEGDFHMTDFNITGDRNDFADATLALVSDGPVSSFTAS